MSEAHVHMQGSPFPLAITSALVVTALLYLRGWLRFRSASNHIPAWRLAAFMTGLFTVWTALGSPLATLDHRSLTIHMVKHLLLMTVAAPLALAGAPVLTLLRALPRPFIQSAPLFSSRRWLGQHLMHPVVCWVAATAAVIGWHLPGTFQLALENHWMHSVEDACFLLAGLLFWWPIVQTSPGVTRSPRWSMALYLFLATLPCDVLSAFLTFCNRVVYPYYLSATRPFGLSSLQDQECAGALMWVWVTFAYLIPAVVITMKILAPSNAHSQQPVQATWHRATARSLNGSEAGVL
jgi:putative membrane protein